MFDKTLVKYLLLFYAIAFVVSVVSGILAQWEGMGYDNYSWVDLTENAVVRYTAKFVFVFFALFFVRYLLQSHKVANWVGFLLHLFFVVALTFYSVASQIVISNLISGTHDPLTWDYVYSRALLGTDYNFFLYFCSAVIVYAYDYFKKQKDFQVRESKLKAQLLDSKVKSLQMQLQPHFLFNTLNDIASLIVHDPEKAQNSIVDLSEMLRQTLLLRDTRFIAFKEEIQLLQRYLDIEKIRYDNKLDIQWNLADETLHVQVPPLLLQPILENSLKHGFSMTHDRLEIGVTSRIEKGFLVCTIQNNGKPLPLDEQPLGIGLANIISRLETLYAGNFEFDLKNNPQKSGVVTLIKIPL